MPEIYIIGGCNGAGKTTAAYDLLPDVFNTVEFIMLMKLQEGCHLLTHQEQHCRQAE